MRNIDAAISKINKTFNEQLIKEGTDYIYVEKIPFSSPTANYMTYGGVPVGKVTEFYGGEGSGKTTSAIDIVGNAQKLYEQEYDCKLKEYVDAYNALLAKKQDKKAKKYKVEMDAFIEQGPKVAVYIDAENTLDVNWARLNGVDTESLILVRPQSQSAEQVLQMIIDLIDTGNVGIVVLDSIPCLVPQIIFEESLEKKSYGGVAGPMTIFSGKIVPYLTKHHTTLLMINQVRENMSSPYQSETTPGGRALRHLYSLRVRFKKGNLIDKKNNEVPSRTENPAGNIVQMEVVKTKVCRPDRRLGYYTLKYYSGIDDILDIITIALKYGYIEQSGSWYSLVDPNTGDTRTFADDTPIKFQGKPKLYEFLAEDEVIVDELMQYIDKIILDKE